MVGDPDGALRRNRMARFEREARCWPPCIIPIARINGIEHRALVMDLVEGEIRSHWVGPGASEDV